MKPIRYILSYILVALLSMPVFAHQESKAQSHVTDEKIMGIIMAVDNSEIAAATIVKNKKITNNVGRYANYLHKQHLHNLHLLKKLQHQTGLIPMASTQSTMIEKDAKNEAAKLTALNGRAFEVAYIHAMVVGHADGLKLIDTVLLKEVTNAKLKQFVEHFRILVARHLEKGKKIQATM